MRKPRKNTVPMSRIIVDSRDAGKDEFIPTTLAHMLYKQGKLALDLTNSTPAKPVYVKVK